MDGTYDHAGRGDGLFEFHLDTTADKSFPSVDLVVEGSGIPVVDISYLDYFWFDDGGEIDDIDRTMSLNGKANADLDMWFAIGGGDVDFKSDDLPLVFFMTGARTTSSTAPEDPGA